MNDGFIREALDMWFGDQERAASEFGNIFDWNTAGISNLERIFCGYSLGFCGRDYWYEARSFNADLSKWDVSRVATFYSSEFLISPQKHFLVLFSIFHVGSI